MMSHMSSNRNFNELEETVFSNSNFAFMVPVQSNINLPPNKAMYFLVEESDIQEWLFVLIKI